MKDRSHNLCHQKSLNLKKILNLRLINIYRTDREETIMLSYIKLDIYDFERINEGGCVTNPTSPSAYFENNLRNY